MVVVVEMVVVVVVVEVVVVVAVVVAHSKKNHSRRGFRRLRQLLHRCVRQLRALKKTHQLKLLTLRQVQRGCVS